MGARYIAASVIADTRSTCRITTVPLDHVPMVSNTYVLYVALVLVVA